jgi:hypothetical protein
MATLYTLGMVIPGGRHAFLKVYTLGDTTGFQEMAANIVIPRGTPCI